jgi:hypothetical protein
MTLPEKHIRLTHMPLERDRVPLVLMFFPRLWASLLRGQCRWELQDYLSTTLPYCGHLLPKHNRALYS